MEKKCFSYEYLTWDKKTRERMTEIVCFGEVKWDEKLEFIFIKLIKANKKNFVFAFLVFFFL